MNARTESSPLRRAGTFALGLACAALMALLALVALSGDGSGDPCRDSVYRDPVTGRSALMRPLTVDQRAACRNRAAAAT